MSVVTTLLRVSLPLFLVASLGGLAHAQGWPDLMRPAASTGGGAKDAAVVVGVDDYVFVSDVPGADDNALAWAQYLNKTRGVSLARITLLQNSQATRESLETALKKAAKDVRPGGTLWFIFIGHGAASQDGKDGVLIGADAQNSASSIYSRGLSREQALQWLEKGRQKHTVAVLDTCFSGQGGDGKAVVAGLQPLIPTKEDSLPQKKLSLFTAGTSNQFAGPLPGADRPAFSYLMLGALRGWGDADQNGEVTAQEARDYTWSTLQFLLRGSRAQTPQLISPEPQRTLVASRKLEKGPDVFALGTQTRQTEPKQLQPQVTMLPEEIVSFDSSPRGVAVMVDGKLLCQQTPCSRSLSVGSHKVEMIGDCVQPGQKQIQVRKGQDLSAVLELTLRTAPLTVRAQDEKGNALKAWVTVDEQKLGQTPNAFPVSICAQEIKVELPGHQTWSSKLNLRSGQGMALRADLVSKVEAKPKGPTRGSVMVQIPAGEFERGTNLKKSSDETPRRTIYLDAFEIDKYEATVADYEACIQAGACETPSNKYQDKKYFNYGAPGREKHPINGINWFQAEAFCKWAGKRLPTEAEWEKAARGTDGRTYPWGEAEPTCDYLVIKKNKFGCDRESTWPVGSKPYGKSPYGVYDMMGNAWEWTADWYQKDYFQSAPSRNPKGPSSGINRVSRGLGWFNDVKDVRVTNRFSAVPTKGPDGQGVRCAR